MKSPFHECCFEFCPMLTLFQSHPIAIDFASPPMCCRPIFCKCWNTKTPILFPCKCEHGDVSSLVVQNIKMPKNVCYFCLQLNLRDAWTDFHLWWMTTLFYLLLRPSAFFFLVPTLLSFVLPFTTSCCLQRAIAHSFSTKSLELLGLIAGCSICCPSRRPHHKEESLAHQSTFWGELYAKKAFRLKVK